MCIPEHTEQMGKIARKNYLMRNWKYTIVYESWNLNNSIYFTSDRSAALRWTLTDIGACFWFGFLSYFRPTKLKNTT